MGTGYPYGEDAGDPADDDIPFWLDSVQLQVFTKHFECQGYRVDLCCMVKVKKPGDLLFPYSKTLG